MQQSRRRRRTAFECEKYKNNQKPTAEQEKYRDNWKLRGEPAVEHEQFRVNRKLRLKPDVQCEKYIDQWDKRRLQEMKPASLLNQEYIAI